MYVFVYGEIGCIYMSLGAQPVDIISQVLQGVTLV